MLLSSSVDVAMGVRRDCLALGGLVVMLLTGRWGFDDGVAAAIVVLVDVVVVVAMS